MTRKKYDDIELDKISFAFQRKAYTPDTMLYAYERDYRDTRILETFIEYLIDFHKYYFKCAMEEMGVFFSVLIYPVYLAIDFFEEWIPYYRKEIVKPLFAKRDELHSNSQDNVTKSINFAIGEDGSVIEEEAVVAKSVEHREEQGTLSDKYCSDKEKKFTKSEAINYIRKYLYENNFTLKANKVGNDLSFGEGMNEALSVTISNIVELKRKSINKSCLVLKRNFKDIEEKLRQLLQEEVRIEFVTEEVKSKGFKNLGVAKLEILGFIVAYVIVKLIIVLIL